MLYIQYIITALRPFYTFNTLKSPRKANRRSFFGQTQFLEPRRMLSATTTLLTASADTLELGHSETFTATILCESGTPNSGSVTFYDSSVVIGTTPVQDGTAILSTTTLPAGIHVITATYSGAGGFESSSSVLGQSSIIRTIAGDGYGYYNGDGIPATNAYLGNPQGVAVDNLGNLYFADLYNSRIRKVDAVTHLISTVAGTGSGEIDGQSGGYNGDGIPATQARLNYPRDVAVDADGNLYIADTNNYRIRRVDAHSHLISTVAGTGIPFFNGDGLAATQTNFWSPTAVAVDNSGNLFVAESDDVVEISRIREVLASTQTMIIVAGTDSVGYNGDGITANFAELHGVNDVAVNSRGDLFISDTGNERIRKVDAHSHTISTVAGNGTFGYNGNGMLATSTELELPDGIAIDDVGNLYIADLGSERIRKVDALTGIVSTVAGNGDRDFYGDGGAALAAALTDPRYVAVDGRGNLFIADTNNNRVRMVTSGPSTVTVTGISNPSIVVQSSSSSLINGVSTVDFGGTTIGSPHTQRITISNSGNADLIVQPVSVPIGFRVSNNLTVNQAISAGMSVSFVIEMTASAVGIYNGRVTITSTDGLFTFNVLGTVNAGGNHAPIGAPKTVTTAENTAYVLTTGDFGFSDPNDHPSNLLKAVKITSLSSNGNLTNSGVLVTVGQFVSTADIGNGKLVFTPKAGASTNIALVLCKFEVQDNGGTSGGGVDLDQTARVLSIILTPINRYPLLWEIESTPLVAIGPLSTPVTSTLRLYDQDSDNWAGATIQISGNYQKNQDVLSFTNTSKIKASWNSTTGVLTLSGIDSVSNYRTALRSVTYHNTSSSPNTSLTRTVRFQSNDGQYYSNVISRDLTVQATAAAPTLSGFTASQTFVPGGAHLAVVPNLVVTHPDGLSLSSATVSVANWQAGDRLGFSNPFALQTTFSENLTAHTATLTIAGIDTVADYQTLLRSVTYWSTAADPLPSILRTVTIVVKDVLSKTASGTQDVLVKDTNRPPVVTINDSTNVTYKANATGLALFSGVTITDPDSNNLTSLTVQITSGYQFNAGGSDILSFTNIFGIRGSFNLSNGLLTLTGTASVGAYREALRLVTFTSTGKNVSKTIRTFTVIATDDHGSYTGSSVPVTRNLTVI